MARKHEEKAHHAPSAARSARRSGKQKATAVKALDAGKTKKEKRAKSKRPTPSIPASRLTEAVPDEAAIHELLTRLDGADQKIVSSILQGLEDHFGSAEAARLWLAVKSPEFGITPLEAIRIGKAKLVQAVLEAQWGPNPIYA